MLILKDMKIKSSQSFCLVKHCHLVFKVIFVWSFVGSSQVFWDYGDVHLSKKYLKNLAFVLTYDAYFTETAFGKKMLK